MPMIGLIFTPMGMTNLKVMLCGFVMKWKNICARSIPVKIRVHLKKQKKWAMWCCAAGCILINKKINIIVSISV